MQSLFLLYILNIKKFLSETYRDLDDNVNLIKVKGDYEFFNKNYATALEFYQTSLSKLTIICYLGYNHIMC